MLSARGTFLLLGLWIFANSENIFDKLNQNEYKVQYVRAEVAYYDGSVQKYVNMTTFKYNRTYTATNITFEYSVDMNEDIDIVIQVYKLASNEYRTFPIRYRVNFCLVLKHNAFGMGKTITCEKGSLCPMKKDVKYFSNYFHPDENKFPPLIPTGEYKVEITFLQKEKDIGCQNYYGSVYRPIKIPK